MVRFSRVELLRHAIGCCYVSLTAARFADFLLTAGTASGDLAERVAAIAPPKGWADLVKRPDTYPTVLWRIDRSTAVEILRHAYVMLSAHRFLDIPLTAQQLRTAVELESWIC